MKSTVWLLAFLLAAGGVLLTIAFTTPGDQVLASAAGGALVGWAFAIGIVSLVTRRM